MPYPNHKNKYAEKAVFSPCDYLDYIRKKGRCKNFKPPQGIIFCYQRSLMKHILDNHRTTSAKDYFGGLYLLDETHGRVGILGSFGIGAPVAVTFLDELIALGVKRFITVGSAGSLQKDIKTGDVVVCDRAIRDEGTSYHYLKPGKYAHASPELTSKIKQALDGYKLKYVVGTSWTTDAPFRETIAEVKQYQKEGVAMVEMEAAALMAVAEYRQVEMGAILTASDSLAALKWKPNFHLKRTEKGLEKIYKVALKALLDEKMSDKKQQ